MSNFAKGTLILDAEVAAAKKGLDSVAKSTDNVTKSMRKAEKQSKALTAATNKMGNALMLGAAAGALLLGNSIRLAARTQTLGVVVNKLGENAGYTAEQMDELTQGVVDQGITLRHSRTAIAMMAQANIDLAKSSDLARLAQDAAVIANLNSSETFQRLIQVVQTGNIRMARHLGLVVDFQRAYMTFAKANNTTTDALTQQEKAQIRVTEVMRAGQAITGTYTAAMDTAGKKVLSLERHLEESSRIIGELFLPAFADAIDGITKFLESIEGMDEGQRASLSTAIVMTTGFLALGGAILKLRGPFLALKVWLAEVTIGTAAATAGISLVVAAMAAMTVVAVSHHAALRANVLAIDELVDAAIKEGATLDEVRWLIEKEAEARGESLITLKARQRALQEGGYASGEYASGIEDIFAAEYEAIKAAKEFETVAERRAEIMKLAQSGMLAVTGEAISLADAQAKAAETAEDMGAKTQSALESMTSAWAENITFIEAGGLEAVAAFEAIKQAVIDESITTDEAKNFTGAILLELDENIAEASGKEWDFSKASESISENMNQPLEQFISYLNSVDGRHTVTYHTTVERVVSELDFVPHVPDTKRRFGQDTSLDRAAQGGHLGTGWNLVGEQGQELIYNGMVFTAQETSKLLATGALGDYEKHAIPKGAGNVATGSIYQGPTDPGRVVAQSYVVEDIKKSRSSSSSVIADISATTQAVEETVSQEMAILATALPSSRDIASGIQEAQLAQIQASLRATQEQIALLEDLVALTAEAGTSDDIGRAVRDNMASSVI